MVSERQFQDKKADFLIKMYETYNKEIDRHFGFAWQVVSVFAASLVTILTATETISGVPAYIALSLYLIFVGWAFEMIIDAYFWYNRNLVVIANIERQFMGLEDAKDIHYYFLSHRPRNKPITFFASLLLFLALMALAVAAFYFLIPWTQSRWDFYREFRNYVPLFVLVVCLLTIRTAAHRRNGQYAEFLSLSPGLNLGSAPASSEHAFIKAGGLGSISAMVTEAENRLLTFLGIEM